MNFFACCFPCILIICIYVAIEIENINLSFKSTRKFNFVRNFSKILRLRPISYPILLYKVQAENKMLYNSILFIISVPEEIPTSHIYPAEVHYCLKPLLPKFKSSSAMHAKPMPVLNPVTYYIPYIHITHSSFISWVLMLIRLGFIQNGPNSENPHLYLLFLKFVSCNRAREATYLCLCTL